MIMHLWPLTKIIKCGKIYLLVDHNIERIVVLCEVLPKYKIFLLVLIRINQSCVKIVKLCYTNPIKLFYLCLSD